MDENALSIILALCTVENYVFSKYLGLCPFLGMAGRMESAFGMGCAVIVVMTLASGLGYMGYVHLLEPWNLQYLDTLFFIFVIAFIVQCLELALKIFWVRLHRAMGMYLPLLSTNCAILGVAQLTVSQAQYNSTFDFADALFHGFGGGLGFALAISIMTKLRGKLEPMVVSPAMRGPAISFFIAGFLALAFQGFSL